MKIHKTSGSVVRKLKKNMHAILCSENTLLRIIIQCRKYIFKLITR